MPPTKIVVCGLLLIDNQPIPHSHSVCLKLQPTNIIVISLVPNYKGGINPNLSLGGLMPQKYSQLYSLYQLRNQFLKIIIRRQILFVSVGSSVRLTCQNIFLIILQFLTVEKF